MFAEPVFKVEMLDFNKPVTPYYNKSNEDISNEIVRPLQDKVNDLTSDLQSIYDSITEAGGEHTAVPSYDIFKEGSNKDELLLQIRDLYSAIESIQSLKEDAQMRLNQLLQPKQHEDTVPEFYPEDAFDHVIVDEQYQAGLDTVHEICKKLDTLLSSIQTLILQQPTNELKLMNLSILYMMPRRHLTNSMVVISLKLVTLFQSKNL